MAPTTEKVGDHFPEDLCFSILAKLPLKSLKRFTCVCKSWAMLFENSYFMNMFRNILISKHTSFYDHDDVCLLLKYKEWVPPFPYRYVSYLISGEKFENKVKLDLPPPFRDNHIANYHILGSDGMNGTLCLYNSYQTIIVLWNPATGEFKDLPPIPLKSPPFTAAPHGFGYDHVRDDYKVICHVTYQRVPTPTCLEFDSWHIYSLRSNSWRELKVEMPIRYVSIAGAEVYLNGVCHWFGRARVEIYVVSFNLSSEEFLTTPIPSDMHDGFPYEWVGRHFLMVLNGFVTLISKHPKTASFHISILGELGVKESWTKLFILGPIAHAVHHIGIGKKGDIFFKKHSGELVHFDLSTQAIKEYGVRGEFVQGQIAIYKKNLLLLKE